MVCLRFLAIAFLLLAAPTPSRAAPPTLDLCSGWFAGQKLDFVARRVEESKEPGEPETRVVSALPVQLEVLHRDVSGFRIAWTYGTTLVEENTDGPLAAWALSLFDGLRVELRTGVTGRVQSITNARSVREFLVGKRRQMALELEKIEADADAKELLCRVLLLLTEPQRGANLPLPDVEFLLQVCGQSLTLGQRQSAEPASAAFERFGRKVSFVLRSIDRDRGRATIEWRNEEKEAKEFLGALLRLVAEVAGTPRERFEVRDAGTIEFDLETGWPERVSHERTLRFGKAVDRTRASIELVPPARDPT